MLETRSLLQKLHSLIRNENEYFSQASALYFLGINDKLPKKIKLVTAKQRRNRIIDGHEIEFIVYSTSRPHQTLVIKNGKLSFRVTSLEMTLIDLANSSDHGLSLRDLGELFVITNTQLTKMVKLASQISETALKRTLFWLLWAGRIDSNVVANFKLNRSPVTLEPGANYSLALRENLVYVLFPRQLIEFFPAINYDSSDERHLRWLELRSLPDFIKYCTQHQWLPIRNDSRPRKMNLLEEFYRQILAKLSEYQPEKILSAMLPGSGIRLGNIPAAALEWLVNSGEICQILPWLDDWLATNLNQKNSSHIGLLMFYAFKTGRKTMALETLVKHGRTLLFADELALLEWMCDQFINDKRPTPAACHIFKARVMARKSNYAECFQIAQAAQKLPEARHYSTDEQSEIAIVKGTALMRLKDFTAAGTEFTNAWQIIESGDNQLLKGGIMQMRGNLYYMQQYYKEARIMYRQALQFYTAIGDIARQEPLYFNLGLLMFHDCRYLESGKFFRKSINIGRQLDQKSQLCNSLSAYAFLLINQGKTSQALELLHECLRLSAIDKTAESSLTETLTFMAYAHELEGNTKEADRYWQLTDKQQASRDSIRSRFVVQYIEAIKHILRNRRQQATALIDELLANGHQNGASTEDIGGLLYRKAMLELIDNSSQAAESLELAAEALAEFPDNFQTYLLKVIRYLFKPAKKPEFPADAFKKLLTQRVYDPLWYFYAHLLKNEAKVEARDYLQHHLQLSHKNFVDTVCCSFAPFKAAFSPDKPATKLQVYFITQNGRQMISQTQYRKQSQSGSTRTISIDMIKGQLHIADLKIKIRSDSYPLKILKQLIIAHPAALDPAGLFKRCWGEAYDREWDAPALESAITRLRKTLKPLEAYLKIIRRHNQENGSEVLLRFATDWQAFM